LLAPYKSFPCPVFLSSCRTSGSSAGHPGPGANSSASQTTIALSGAGHPGPRRTSGPCTFCSLSPVRRISGPGPRMSGPSPAATHNRGGARDLGAVPHSLPLLSPSRHTAASAAGLCSGAAPALSSDLRPRSPAHGFSSSRSTVLSNPFLGLWCKSLGRGRCIVGFTAGVLHGAYQELRPQAP
jgi:hypothetical protein